MFQQGFSIIIFSALKPNEYERKRALIGALCEILWTAGEKKRCCICLSQEDRCYDQDYRVRDDGITEKVSYVPWKGYLYVGIRNSAVSVCLRMIGAVIKTIESKMMALQKW